MSIFNLFILQKTYPQTEIYTLSCIKERKSLKQPFFNLTRILITQIVSKLQAKRGLVSYLTQIILATKSANYLFL